jgi:hypothetical protein
MAARPMPPEKNWLSTGEELDEVSIFFVVMMVGGNGQLVDKNTPSDN